MLSVVVGAWITAITAFAQEVPSQKPGTRPSIDPPGQISPDWKTPGSGGEPKGDQLVKVRGTADVDAIIPGQTFLLAFMFQIDPGWHIYWKNSGASGAATEVKVSGPAGFVIGKTLFPRPQALTEPEGTVYAYEGETALFVEVTPPIDPPPTTSAMFRAEIDWLVCKDVCKVGGASRIITLPVSSSLSRPTERKIKDASVDRFKARLPRMIANGQADAIVELKDGILRVELPAQGRSSAEFFPNETAGLTYGSADIKVEKDRVMVKVPAEIKPQNAVGKSIVFNGLVALGESLDDPCFEFEFSLPAP